MNKARKSVKGNHHRENTIKKGQGLYKAFFKRVFDICSSFMAIVIFLPLLALIALLIKLNSKGPVLFFQKRVGKNKSHFKIAKFRTMFADTPGDVPTHLLKNPDMMITSVGRFLRKTSLDELPQLFNILGGSMSVVGPRPALYNQYDLIEERDKYDVNLLVPGLTGWAQVNGRDELPIPIKANLDGYYARHIGFLLDIKIIFMTVFNVFTARGIAEGNQDDRG